MASRRCFRRSSIVILLVLTGLATPANGQFRLPQDEPSEDDKRSMNYVPPGREILQALAQSREALKQGKTADAFNLLQRLIDLPEDYFTDRTMQRTLKSDALQILTDLTRPERDAYELLQGTAARQLLNDAKAAGDSRRLAEVVRRHPQTQAALEVAELLALEAMDHGRSWQAASQFAALRRVRTISAEQVRAIGLLEAIAWHQSGETARAQELMVELTAQKGALGMRISGEAVPQLQSSDQAGRWLIQVAGPPGRANELQSAEWLSPRGSPSGAAPARNTGPISGPTWGFRHLFDLEANLPLKNVGPAGETLAQLLNLAEEPLLEWEQPAWTTTTPLVVGEMIIFRTARDIVALDRRTGEFRWRSVLAQADFDRLWSDLRTVSPDAGLTQYLRTRLYDDRTFGSLSSDGNLLFALEGFEFQFNPVNNNVNNGRIFIQNAEPEWEGFNRLAAYEVAGGRLAWEIGGDRRVDKGDFAGHFFLGSPLACDGLIFVLAEVQGETRLVALESQTNGVRKVWSQPLVVPALSVDRFEDRQRQGLMPACSNGIVICPTGTGAVVAVDFALRRLLWSFVYPSNIPPAAPGMHPMIAANLARMNRQTNQEDTDRGWLEGNPILAEGRVFITPTDSDSLHCISLVDGKELWSVPRDRGLFLAGADAERALIVGPDRIEALKSSDGTPAWPQPLHIPMPSGRGVWMEQSYLIPLSTGEIASIDLASGRLMARSRLPDGRLPGNLAAGSGALVSLSARDVFGFRSVQETERFIADRLATDPQDAQALAQRGELRLHRGEFQAGLADLREAIARQSEPYAKSVLASALLEGLRTDFAHYRDTVPELESLTVDPEQRHEFLWLVARGLQREGESLAAFERMTHLADDALNEYTQETFGAPWKARNDRRLWGLFESLYQAASPEDRKVLDRQIATRLPPAAEAPADAEARGPSDVVGGLRRFLRTFGFHHLADQARQRLIAGLDRNLDAVEWELEATRLANTTDSAVAGPAVAALARWSVARHRFDDADRWLAVLESRFAEIAVDAEITGAQTAATLRSDPAILEHAKQPRPWPAGEIESKRSNKQSVDGMMIRALVAGPVPAKYQGWSFETDRQGLILVARDEQARQRWRLNRGNSGQATQYFQPGQHQVLLHDQFVGWSNGVHFVIAADIEPDRNPPRPQWEDSLLPPGMTGANAATFFGNPRARFAIRQRWNDPRFGSMGNGPGTLVAITDFAVIYHNGRKLIAADPLTGKLLWSRKDLPPFLSQISADDRVVTLVGPGHLPGENRNSIRVLRAIDGEQLTEIDEPAGVIAWIGSQKVLHSTDAAQPAAGPQSLAVYDLVRGEAVWKADIARPAVHRVMNDEEVFTIEENRRLTVRNLSDGSIRWSRDLKLAVAAEALFVQRWQDQYLITVGVTSPQPALPENPRVIGFDNQHIPIDGHVIALKRGTGEILWTNRIETTAYDASQPVGWPVLVYAGRMFVTQRAAGVPTIPRLTTTLIDKATGKLLYSVEEPSNIGGYFLDVDPDRNRLSANYLNWTLELRYTGKPAE